MSTDMTDDALVTDAESEPELFEDGAEIDLDAPTDHQRAGGASRGLALLLTIGGAIGFIAAFTLLIERIQLFKDPSYVPTCSFNPVLSCGSVMETSQASAFGFPNPIIGVASFAAITTIGVALLGRSVVPRWFWLGLQAGTIFGAGFITWLAYQSLYNIEKLCPYCMVVWTVMIPIFVYVTAHNVQAGHIPASVGVRNFLVRNKALIVLAWYLLIVALILVQFWDYWSTLI